MNKFSVLILVLIPFVSGQIFDMNRITGGESNLARFGLMILLFVVIASVLSQISIFKNNKVINVMVAAAISQTSMSVNTDLKMFIV